VKDVESIRAPQAGRDLHLSLDWRLQYLAYRELKAEVIRHKARSGSIVLLDVATGEILAMVNQPSYNPNDVSSRRGSSLRNRAMTDMFEPGSTMKPFTAASALELGRVTPATMIDTKPGRLEIGSAVVKDHRDYGAIDVSTVIQKSSNVGISKIALDMPIKELLQFYSSLGFGVSTGSGFPGEVDGRLDINRHWSKIGQATLAFGYGLSVTPLQLAQAYAIVAADGVRRPPSLLRQDEEVVGERVMSQQTARQLRTMLESVVSPEGTANSAAIKGYRVAGKTGTVKKSTKGGYTEDQFLAVFAGMVPASDPRLVMVVVIDEPKGKRYYGGQVAAPLFSRVMTGVLRIMNIAPDDMGDDIRIAAGGGVQ
jgi:cell division protein FtsI (penicillin-binding protein 3)